MGIIVLGRGDFFPPHLAEPVSERVTIPQGATFHFLSDYGDGLRLGPSSFPVWEHLCHAQQPHPAGGLLTNLTVHHDAALADRSLPDHPDFRGFTLVRPGVDGCPEPLRLCTCTPGEQPKDPDSRHTCDGLLGREDVRGDVFWVAGSSFLRVDQPRAAMFSSEEGFEEQPSPEESSCDELSRDEPSPGEVAAEGQTGAFTADDPNWKPSRTDRDEAAGANRYLMRMLRGGETLHCALRRRLLLVSEDSAFSNHAPRHVKWVLAGASTIRLTACAGLKDDEATVLFPRTTGTTRLRMLARASSEQSIPIEVGEGRPRGAPPARSRWSRADWQAVQTANREAFRNHPKLVYVCDGTVVLVGGVGDDLRNHAAAHVKAVAQTGTCFVGRFEKNTTFLDGGRYTITGETHRLADLARRLVMDFTGDMPIEVKSRRG